MYRYWQLRTDEDVSTMYFACLCNSWLLGRESFWAFCKRRDIKLGCSVALSLIVDAALPAVRYFPYLSHNLAS